MYGDKVQIRDINGQIEVDSNFNGMYDDRIYVVIDKQEIGESIGRDILDAYPDIDIEDDCHIAYGRIESSVTDEIIEDIYSYVQEYINNNQ